jgi:hypothetical protein
MLTMKDNIEFVQDVEVGIDFLHSPRYLRYHAFRIS